MKKLLILLLLTVSSFTFAGSSSNRDDFKTINSNCMIDFHDENTSRFVNVSYIKAIEIKNKKSELMEFKSSNELRMHLGSGYNTPTHFTIAYKSNEEAIQALNNLVKKINECK